MATALTSVDLLRDIRLDSQAILRVISSALHDLDSNNVLPTIPIDEFRAKAMSENLSELFDLTKRAISSLESRMDQLESTVEELTLSIVWSTNGAGES